MFRRPKFTKRVSVGVVDVHTHVIETLKEVKEGIRKSLSVFDPEQVWIDPDCGLKTRSPQEAMDKMKVMVEATREVKQELGLA